MMITFWGHEVLEIHYAPPTWSLLIFHILFNNIILAHNGLKQIVSIFFMDCLFQKNRRFVLILGWVFLYYLWSEYGVKILGCLVSILLAHYYIGQYYLLYCNYRLENAPWRTILTSIWPMLFYLLKILIKIIII